ncbi:MAG: hypothetical protein CMM47_06055 [Rhodospirillaceae bacterium]|nr:hypothetical protein [Rhodospirillaceae bacterium]
MTSVLGEFPFTYPKPHLPAKGVLIRTDKTGSRLRSNLLENEHISVDPILEWHPEFIYLVTSNRGALEARGL